MSISSPITEWVDFFDPAEPGKPWRVDVTFMMSSWHCKFGRGCRGITGDPRWGCCTEGVVLEPEEVDLFHQRVEALTPEEWERHGTSPVLEGMNTSVLDGRCVFSNSPDFPGGGGCAFHVAALRRGESPIAWKPYVCWSIPLLFEDAVDHKVLRRYHNVDWSPDGKSEPLQWWCVDSGHETYDGTDRVYLALKEELEAIVGPEVYRAIKAYCDEKKPTTSPQGRPVALRPPRVFRESGDAAR